MVQEELQMVDPGVALYFFSGVVYDFKTMSWAFTMYVLIPTPPKDVNIH